MDVYQYSSMNDWCQTAMSSFTKMLITSLEWYRTEINQQHSTEAWCVPIENKEKLFSTYKTAVLHRVLLETCGLKVHLHSEVRSWCCEHVYSCFSTYPSSVHSEAREIGKNLSKLQSGWIQLRQVCFQLLRTVYLWPDLKCFSVTHLNSKTAFHIFRWFVLYVNQIRVMISLPVTFFSTTPCWKVFQFIISQSMTRTLDCQEL